MKIPLSGFSVREVEHIWLLFRNLPSYVWKLLKKAVRKETSGHFEFALLTILRCAENPTKYFAKLLYKAMKVLGTEDSTLIKIVVTRVEIDMQYIKAKYQKNTENHLWETSSHYRTFLLALIGPKN